MSRGMHKHKCAECHTVWEHPDTCVARGHEVFEESHTCPKCGKPGCYWKYRGPDAAPYVGVCEDGQSAIARLVLRGSSGITRMSDIRFEQRIRFDHNDVEV